MLRAAATGAALRTAVVCAHSEPRPRAQRTRLAGIRTALLITGSSETPGGRRDSPAGSQPMAVLALGSVVPAELSICVPIDDAFVQPACGAAGASQ